MAGPNKNVRFKRAKAAAEIYLANPEITKLLNSFDTNTDDGLKLLSVALNAKGIEPLVASLLVSYQLGGKLPSDWLGSTSVAVWSPKHRIYGADTKNVTSSLYYTSPTHEGPKPRDDRIYLVLRPSTTRNDMEYFMKRHWARDVIPLLNDLGLSSRVKNSTRIMRDSEIRAKHLAGDSYTKLANDYDLSKRRIEQITKE